MTNKDKIKLPNNPFRYCKYYKTTKPDKNGVICCHVDGPLCDVNTCDANAPYKEEIYKKMLVKGIDIRAIIGLLLVFFWNVFVAACYILLEHLILGILFAMVAAVPAWFVIKIIYRWD